MVNSYLQWPHLLLILGIIVAMSILACIVLPHYYRIWQVYLWKRTLHLKRHARCFNFLFHDVNGFQLSKQARTTHDVTDYIYGEIEFISFAALMSLSNPTPSDIFYDLGSGIGKAVITYAMVFPVQKAVGVEVLESLHQSACAQKEKLTQIEEYRYLTSKIEFCLDNFLDCDLQEATIIFVNSTTLFQPTWGALCAKLDTLPQLKTVITTSKPLISNRFKTQKCTQVEMSWGIIDAYIHHF